jgi:cell division protein FtsZ
MDAEEIRQVRIRVLGIGGAGSNALDQMLKAGGDRIDYVAINTDRQDLAQSNAPHKIQIGENITHGLGAGGNPDVGRQAAVDSMTALEAALEGCDLLFLVAGFGGGTGTGAAPVIAQMARERNILTICIATTPFDFEGQKRKAQALEGLRLVDEHADTVIVAPNDKLFQVADLNGSMKDAFDFTNDILAEGVQCIVRLISRTGLINLDFADVRTIVARGGRAALGFATSSGQGSAVEAARRALDNPLFDQDALSRARGLLISIMGGDDLGLREVQDAAATISRMGNRNAHVIFGALVDPAFHGQRLVTVLATSLDGDRGRAAEAPAAAAGEPSPAPVPQQTLIDLDFKSYEHFEDTEPTILEGENLDIPTFLRKGVRVSAVAG